jgi:signal transduction histidine kinase
MLVVMQKLSFSHKFVFGTIILIALLLLANVIAVYENNKIITRNNAVQHQTEIIKLHALEMLRTLHLLDIGLRGYAITPETPTITLPYDTAVRRKDRHLHTLAEYLSQQNFPMASYDSFRTEVDQYYKVSANMRRYLDNGDREAFMATFKTDPGYSLQKVYRKFLQHVTRFENDTAQKAKLNYERAIRFNYLLQAIVFLITVPTLCYLGFYSSKTFSFAKRLHQAEVDNTNILRNQNEKLEYEVQLRTHELLSLNEEITTQNEEIMTSNEQLVMQREQIEQQHTLLLRQHDELKNAQKVIEQQNATITQHNNALVQEVDSQSTYLSRANTVLKERNTQLEQFAYIISHNLRGPLSRIQGLASIMDFVASPDEIHDLAKKISGATIDLDRVIKDLSLMIDVPQIDERAFTEVNLVELTAKVIDELSTEIKQEGVTVNTNLRETKVRSLYSYLENIFFNLIQNAIKYRSPDRKPIITVSSYKMDGQLILEVEDNGLGIDIQRHKTNLFMPYKRFHLHVEGRGLGLYLVRARVEALKGKIEIESHVNIGSRFRMSWPLAE